jgi:poly(A) polymerase
MRPTITSSTIALSISKAKRVVSGACYNRCMSSAVDIIRDGTRGTAFEGDLYLVGGVLRDRFLGLEAAEDVDLVTEGDAVALAGLLYAKGLSEHHPVEYPRFGTAKIRVAGHDVELVTARAESYDPASRKPSVQKASLKDDAFRRDFTINTLMENIHTGEVLDLTGLGYVDLRAGLIRTPLGPRITFYDDPLRMLRAVRFAARLGFEIAADTWEAVCAESHRLNLMGPEPAVVSAERIRDEFVKTMMSPDPVRGLELMRQSGLLGQFFPELLEMVGVTQNAWHLYDVWDHTMLAMRSLPSGASLEVRLAVLLHDVGKPRTRSEDERGIHFYEHQFVGAEMSRHALHRLKFTGDQVGDITELVARHMRLGESRPEWSDAAIKRLIRAVHPYTEELFTITACDMAAMNPEAPKSDMEALRARMDALNAQANIAEIKSPLDGREIMEALGAQPGPHLREAKEFLVNEVLDGRLADEDKVAAASILKEWYRSRPDVSRS